MTKPLAKKPTKAKTVVYDVAAQLRTPEEMAAYLDAWLDEAPEDASGIAPPGAGKLRWLGVEPDAQQRVVDALGGGELLGELHGASDQPMRRASGAASPVYEPGVIASRRSFSAAGISSVPMNWWIDSRVMDLPRVNSFSRSYGLGRL